MNDSYIEVLRVEIFVPLAVQPTKKSPTFARVVMQRKSDSSFIANEAASYSDPLSVLVRLSLILWFTLGSPICEKRTVTYSIIAFSIVQGAAMLFFLVKRKKFFVSGL